MRDVLLGIGAFFYSIILCGVMVITAPVWVPVYLWLWAWDKHQDRQEAKAWEKFVRDRYQDQRDEN